MTNKHGEFIWYELMTPDLEAARAFYQPLVGWNIGSQSGMPGIDYRMIDAPDGSVGGMLQIDDAMRAGGAQPMWIGYIAVDDVDAAVAALPGLGGRVLIPAQDIPNVGRYAMAADPDGAPFYIMRGTVEGTSTAFSPQGLGHCSWNELYSPHQGASLEFYMSLFRWTNPHSMRLDESSDYCFLYADDLRIGASMERKDQPASWAFYFRVPSVGAAADVVTARGGDLLLGPHDVPDGDFIIIGTDPQGARFALVGGA